MWLTILGTVIGILFIIGILIFAAIAAAEGTERDARR